MKPSVILITLGIIALFAFGIFIGLRVKKKFEFVDRAVVESQNQAVPKKLALSTSSDSAIHYYYLGWENVMDNGDYTASAEAFRKMAQHDDQFMVGMSLLGRISEDIDEQRTIRQTINDNKKELPEDERLLLDVFNELLQLMIIRQTRPDSTEVQRKKALALGEENFRQIVYKYPADIYYLCEYIEVLNYNHGAKTALDSLYQLATSEQQDQPFLLGYAAMLEAELGNYDLAIEKAEKLAENFKNKNKPKPYIIWGDIYLKMGKLEEAQMNVDKALSIDPGSIDAQRLKTRLEQ